MKKKYKRLTYVILLFVVILTSVTILLDALRDNITFYYSPSEINHTLSGKNIRIGGKVTKDTVVKKEQTTTFIISDSKTDIKVFYDGSLPMLFNEDVEIIASGTINTNNEFFAKKIFTKHNEIYRKKTTN